MRSRWLTVALLSSSVACGTSPYGVSLAQNEAPLVDAGWDTVVSRHTLVTLSGVGIDPEGRPLTFRWEQESGAAVALDVTSPTTATFTSPGTIGDLTFGFVVSDGQNTTTDFVVITVANQAPTVTSVVLSPDPAITSDTLSVAAIGSDADGDPLTWSYAWSKNGVAIAGASASTLASSFFAKGDVVTARATASDGIDTDTMSATLTIADAPPVIGTDAPATAPYGVSMSFQVTATDPDGDAFSFALVGAPSGMTMDASGLVTWTPRPPMLDSSLDVTWVIEASSLAVTSELTGTITVTDATRARPLVRSGIEVPKAPGTLVIADADGDTKVEMLVADGVALLESLEKSGAGYAQDWLYPFALGSGVPTGVALGETSGDSAPELFVATSTSSYGGLGRLVRIDGQSRRVDAEVDESATYLSGLRIGDVDGDGALELVYLVSDSSYGSTSVVIRDAATLTEEWRSGAFDHGSALAVGNVDADAALEVVTSAGYVYDGASHANEWLYGAGFGDRLDVGDVDGDGTAEIVGSTSSGPITGFAATTHAVLWSLSRSSVGPLRCAELDGTAGEEVLVADSYTGSLRSYSYDSSVTPTLVEDWAVASPGSAAGALEVGDVDGDGELEAVVALGTSSSGADSLAVFDLAPTPGLAWQNLNPSQLDGPFVGGLWADLAASDTRALFATPETNSGYDGTRLVTVDATGGVAVTSELATNWQNLVCLSLGDMDQDGYDEAYVGDYATYDGKLEVYDVPTDASLWSYGGTFSVYVDVSAVEGADLDGDGATDLVSLDATGLVRVDSPATSTLLWAAPAAVAGSGVDLVVTDLGGSADAELVALTSSTLAVYRRDTAQPAILTYLAADAVTLDGGLGSAKDLAVGDVDGDGAQELVVLGAGGAIGVYDTTLNLVAILDTGLAASAIFIDTTVPGSRNVMLAVNDSTDGFAYLVAIDATSGLEAWRSPPLLGAVQKNSLHVADTNGDGAPELIFGTRRAMYLSR